jgi:hypothetical protein
MKVYITALTLILLTISGCNLFTPRTPEPPTAGGQVGQEPITSEDSVLANIRKSLASLDGRSYMNSFSMANYRFIPTNQYPINDPRFSPWNFNKENQFIFNLINGLRSNESQARSGTITFQYTAQNKQPFNDGWQYQISYRFAVRYVRAAADSVFTGQNVIITVRQTTGTWSIETWDERPSDNTAVSTLSTLKANANIPNVP